MKGKAIATPYGGKTKRKGGVVVQIGGKVKKHPLHHKLEKVIKKPTKENCGGFIFPLIGHIVKAVRSNKAHKERVKQDRYRESEAGKKAAVENEYNRGKQERQQEMAYKKGYEGGRLKKRH